MAKDEPMASISAYSALELAARQAALIAAGVPPEDMNLRRSVTVTGSTISPTAPAELTIAKPHDIFCDPEEDEPKRRQQIEDAEALTPRFLKLFEDLKARGIRIARIGFEHKGSDQVILSIIPAIDRTTTLDTQQLPVYDAQRDLLTTKDITSSVANEVAPEIRIPLVGNRFERLPSFEAGQFADRKAAEQTQGHTPPH